MLRRGFWKMLVAMATFCLVFILAGCDNPTGGTPPTVVSIEVTTPPTNDQHYGQAFDGRGMVVTATLSDDNTRLVTGFTISGFNPYLSGQQTIIVTYGTHTTTFSVFVLAVQEEESPPADTNGDAAFGQTLVLSAYVYQGGCCCNEWEYTRFSLGSAVDVLSNFQSHTGRFSNSTLSFTISGPPDLSPVDALITGEFWGWDIQVSPDNVQGAILDLRMEYFCTDCCFDTNHFLLMRSRSSKTETATGDTYTEERVMYLFVDGNVTISAERAVESSSGWGNTFEGFEITLYSGWNTLHFKEIFSRTQTRDDNTFTLSHSNPENIKWLIFRRIFAPDTPEP